MCGRLDQHHTALDYVASMQWQNSAPRLASRAAASYNAPPGTWRPLMRVVDGQLVVEDAFWGYRAAWAAARLPVAINARLEKINSSYWARLLKTGRAIVPADGWYEWTGDMGKKQPWHIHLKTREALFIAAIGACGKQGEQPAEAGFVIVTADAEGGMVDVHDRRPVVFSAADAALWLDPDLSTQQAAQLARSAALGPEAFDWHAVDKQVGHAGNDGAQLAVQRDLLD